MDLAATTPFAPVRDVPHSLRDVPHSTKTAEAMVESSLSIRNDSNIRPDPSDWGSGTDTVVVGGADQSPVSADAESRAAAFGPIGADQDAMVACIAWTTVTSSERMGST